MMLLGLMVLLGAWGYCSSLLSFETCRSHGRLAPRLELRFCRLVRATVAQGPRRDLNFAEIGSHQMLWGDLSDAPCMQMAIFTEAVFDCGTLWASMNDLFDKCCCASPSSPGILAISASLCSVLMPLRAPRITSAAERHRLHVTC